MKIYGILIQNKGCIGCLGLFETKEKAKESWKVLENFSHVAALFEYNLRTGKGEELAGMNLFPSDLRFFKGMEIKTKLKFK